MTFNMTEREWDELYADIVAGKPRDENVARWGEELVAYGESHPVVKAALAYKRRK